MKPVRGLCDVLLTQLTQQDSCCVINLPVCITRGHHAVTLFCDHWMGHADMFFTPSKGFEAHHQMPEGFLYISNGEGPNFSLEKRIAASREQEGAGYIAVQQAHASGKLETTFCETFVKSGLLKT
ncbi:hypothetical protein NHX12_016651 [Muraenolepis orangiensis]|uniref:Uncharacterized protein n=1 Tax=Muraenolepis orangiensis TaxID=630683 RepID=A0A9Q0DBJ0_9TELE|nr:hypothetical protein NHX12_016651 [Muraenolepis orangiensis]